MTFSRNSWPRLHARRRAEAAFSVPAYLDYDKIPTRRRRTIANRLREWYQQNARNLPWRRTSDPYHIWVSEVMLQQTQVKTVIPYYNRFLRRFPTLGELAAASPDDVLQLWQGLGYYRRALHLHQAVREVVECWGSEVPRSLAVLRGLPGIGRYIAGAICSFAFNMPTPILEANSARVLCRLVALPGPVSDGGNQRRLWSLSESLLPNQDAGLHNQALIEFGALVCLVKNPRCDKCPLQDQCAAYRDGLTDKLPTRAARPKVIRVRDVTAFIRRHRRVLIVQRAPEDRWGGLWELPRTTVQDDQDPRTALQAHVQEHLGLRINVGPQILSITHDVTHHRITLECYECSQAQGRVRVRGYLGYRWEPTDRLGAHAYSSPQRKLITAIQGLGNGSEATS